MGVVLGCFVFCFACVVDLFFLCPRLPRVMVVSSCWFWCGVAHPPSRRVVRARRAPRHSMAARRWPRHVTDVANGAVPVLLAGATRLGWGATACLLLLDVAPTLALLAGAWLLAGWSYHRAQV